MWNCFLAYLVQCYIQLKWKLFGQTNDYEIPFDLTGWQTVITGGSGEIGLSCLKKLLNKNCQIIIATIPNSGQTMRDLQFQMEQDLKEFKRDLWTLCYLNLSSFESINEFVEKFKKSNRQIDLLINNAGEHCSE